MSLDMTLEADIRLGREDVKALMAACSVEVVDANGTLSGVFVSGMSFLWRDARTSIAPEVADPNVGSRMSFRLVSSKYHVCVEEVGRLIEMLTRISPAHFVLAFRGESALALRDGKGLTYVA